MSHYYRSMKTELNAKDTAQTLGVCDKTLRLWIKLGKLQPVQGTGGQGRALAFNVAEVESFRSRQSGVVDADFLARIAYAFQLKRSTPTCRWLPWFESQMLWTWHKAGKYGQVHLARDNCFPPLSEVPQELTVWASRLGRVLTPDELDYLAAIFVVVEYPSRKYDFGEKWALMHSLEITGQYDRKYENMLEDAYDQGDRDGLRALIEDRKDSSGQYHDAVLNELRIEGNRAPLSLLSASRKQAADRKDQGKGNPTGARVAKLLCIHHRYQATRLLIRIMEKIGQNGMFELVEILGLSRPPRVWQGEYSYKQQRCCRFSWAKAIAPRSRSAVVAKPLVAPKPDALCLQCGAAARLVAGVIVCSGSCGWQMDVETLRALAAEHNSVDTIYSKGSGRTYKKAARVGSPDG